MFYFIFMNDPIIIHLSATTANNNVQQNYYEMLMTSNMGKNITM